MITSTSTAIPMRPTRIVLTVASIALLGAVIALHGALPATIPVHFGLDGRPDRWERSSLAWWGAPALLLVASGWGAALFGPVALRHPMWLNVPAKARWLALPPSARAPVDRVILDLFDLVALSCVVVAALVQLMIWNGARAPDGTGVPWALLATPLAAVLVGVGLARYHDALARAERDAGATA